MSQYSNKTINCHQHQRLDHFSFTHVGVAVLMFEEDLREDVGGIVRCSRYQRNGV